MQDKTDKEHTPDQEALDDLIDEVTNGGRKPVSGEDAEILVGWGREVGFGNSRGPERHPNRGHGSNPHIHVGPNNHVGVK